MVSDAEPQDETVRLTISMPKSLLNQFDEKCHRARPRVPRSRRIQELLIQDLERAQAANGEAVLA